MPNFWAVVDRITFAWAMPALFYCRINHRPKHLGCIIGSELIFWALSGSKTELFAEKKYKSWALVLIRIKKALQRHSKAEQRTKDDKADDV